LVELPPEKRVAVREMREEIERLKRSLGELIPMAEAWWRRAYGERCDHDEDCFCRVKAKVIAEIYTARELLGEKIP
jgi:hypothetical protein